MWPEGCRRLLREEFVRLVASLGLVPMPEFSEDRKRSSRDLSCRSRAPYTSAGTTTLRSMGDRALRSAKQEPMQRLEQRDESRCHPLGKGEKDKRTRLSLDT